MNKEVSWVFTPTLQFIVTILFTLLGINEIHKGASFSIWFISAGLFFASGMIYILSHRKQEKTKKDAVELDKSDAV